MQDVHADQRRSPSSSPPPPLAPTLLGLPSRPHSHPHPHLPPRPQAPSPCRPCSSSLPPSASPPPYCPRLRPRTNLQPHPRPRRPRPHRHPHHRPGTARKCKACEKPNPSWPSKKKLKEAKEAKAEAKAEKLKAEAPKAEAEAARPAAPAFKLPIDVRRDVGVSEEQHTANVQTQNAKKWKRLSLWERGSAGAEGAEGEGSTEGEGREKKRAPPPPPLALGGTSSTRNGKKRSYDGVEGESPPSPSLPPSLATSPNGAVRSWPTSPSPQPGLQGSGDTGTQGSADPNASRVHLVLRGADPGIHRWPNAETRGSTRSAQVQVHDQLHQWPDPRPDPGLYHAAEEDARCLICLGDLDADTYIEPTAESGPARPNASSRQRLSWPALPPGWPALRLVAPSRLRTARPP